MGRLGRIRRYEKVNKFFKKHPTERLLAIENLWGFSSGEGVAHRSAFMSFEALSGQPIPIPNHGEHFLVVTSEALYWGDEPGSMHRIPISYIDGVHYDMGLGSPEVRQLEVAANGDGVAAGLPLIQYWYTSSAAANSVISTFPGKKSIERSS